MSKEQAGELNLGMVHVDEWIRDTGFDDKPEHGDTFYARWLLLHWRLPAYMKNRFARFIGNKRLFCTYEGVRYRCIGASRLGDVWLTDQLDSEVGYKLRVDVSKCLHWKDEPF